ncbi:MAG: T9SS type A sorting domain-containing protein [Bacteroidetes bacterium]|nr:T9SS type A sorting domain-containing protein [Bacteroidota bacterium]
MKKLLLPVLFMVTAISMNAQTIMNADFEKWYNYMFCECELLEGHKNEGDSTHKWHYGQAYGAERQTVTQSKRNDAQNGTYSAHIQRFDYGLNPLRYRMPYTDITEEALRGYYKSNLIDGDSAHIVIYYKKGASTIKSTSSFYISQNTNEWTFFQLPINKSKDADTIAIEFWPSTIDTLSEIWIDNLTLDQLVDVNSPDLANALTVFPNPTRKQVHYTIGGNFKTSTIVSLVDLSGNTLVEKVHAPNNLMGTHQLSVENLPSGVYVLKLQTDKGFTSQKLVID